MIRTQRLVFLILFFMLAANIAEARITAVDWRWRNDDGSEETATWMTAAQNQTGTLVGTEEIVRLRTRHVNAFDFSTLVVSYGDPAVDVAYSDFFAFGDSAYLDIGDSVNKRLTDHPTKTYDAGGRILEAPANVPAAPPDTYQELELCLKARDDIAVPEDTYTFKFLGTAAPLIYLHPRAATVITRPVINIAGTAATAVGEITDLGVRDPHEHGVCWSTAPNPDISAGRTDEGPATTTGEFSTVMSGLTPGTTYYVRAYATNTAGTVYGEEVSFTSGISMGADEESYGAGDCFINTAR